MLLRLVQQSTRKKKKKRRDDEMQIKLPSILYRVIFSVLLYLLPQFKPPTPLYSIAFAHLYPVAPLRLLRRRVEAPAAHRAAPLPPPRFEAPALLPLPCLEDPVLLPLPRLEAPRAGRSPLRRSGRRGAPCLEAPRDAPSAGTPRRRTPRLDVPRDAPSAAAPCLLEDLASSLPPPCLEAPRGALSASAAPPRPRARFLRPSSVEPGMTGRPLLHRQYAAPRAGTTSRRHPLPLRP
ncbi:uncharacterized protein LOC112898349 [Panicum hallii]|uniref:uncharacterized protein LOC112898349 n=1 Tax=Panicum hallii TaxID=206008 RepID=UPI000DF4DDA7|nr:uncharacterized protein LOC112898349 [Panicum hallii]